FIHHDETHSVCEIQKFRRRWIVRSAQTIDAHPFQDFELTFERACIDRRSKRAQVVMITGAAYLYRFAVEEKTFVDVEAKGANAERRLVTIDHSCALA